MYRIAVEDLKTKNIGLISQNGKIQEFLRVEDATIVYEQARKNFGTNKNVYIFNTLDKCTKQNVWNAINTDQLVEQLVMLRERYQDEKGYENENEYVQYAVKNIHERAIKMTKRPFGFIIKCLDGYLQIGVKSYGNCYKTFADTYKGKI